jgi:hypothetical protein
MTMEGLLIAIVFGLIACAVSGGAGAYVARTKGRSEVEGAALGVLLGPIGVLVEALFRDEHGYKAEPPRSALLAKPGDNEAMAFLEGLEPPSDSRGIRKLS